MRQYLAIKTKFVLACAMGFLVLATTVLNLAFTIAPMTMTQLVRDATGL